MGENPGRQGADFRPYGPYHTTERNRAKTIFEQAGAEDISYTEEARV
jgi:hypothetical protein